MTGTILSRILQLLGFKKCRRCTLLAMELDMLPPLAILCMVPYFLSKSRSRRMGRYGPLVFYYLLLLSLFLDWVLYELESYRIPATSLRNVSLEEVNRRINFPHQSPFTTDVRLPTGPIWPR